MLCSFFTFSLNIHPNKAESRIVQNKCVIILYMNSRRSLPYITVAPDTLLSQKKKKTWQCFGGKGPKVILSDIVISCVFVTVQ